ncbi:MAG TPA: VOC family protein [Vicinamibacterales bacterium]|nr:VOC family protein [Vicinamibacterales bacterium]
MAKKKKSPSTARKRVAQNRRAGKKNPSSRLSLAVLRNRRRLDPESLRLRALEPSLTVDDIERSVHFYTDVLGFIVAERWTEGGRLLGVNLKAGSCELGLSQDDWAKGRDRTKGIGVRIWCRTAQDIDALAARIKAAGGQLTAEPEDQSWGVRSLAVDDPDGYHLAIYQERTDAS